MVERHPQLIGIGVDEGTCAVVSGSALEVLGKSKVAVLDVRNGIAGQRIPPVWLAPGDRWDLVEARNLP